jgi:hypothetical protein
MLKNISWSSYLSITAVITAIYYFLVAVIFYRDEITKLLFSGNSHFINPAAKSHTENLNINTDNDFELEYKSEQSEKEDEIQSSSVHQLINELNKIFKKSSEKKYLKEELILAIQLTLKNYLSLKETPFHGAINSLIELESQSQCSIYLNEDEMELLWKAG